MTNQTNQKFKYDVAISLCKEDVKFASKLVKAINPNLTVFFYEHRQDELISKSGPEAFARIFKDESRVVVILSRNEWSTTFYTDIERSAIMDRIKGGYDFLMVMPMKQDETPPWYPASRIYASPFRFTIEQLAQFIEFKVADVGGTVKPPTLEDRCQNINNRIQKKRIIVGLQHIPEAIESTKNELNKFKNCFNDKYEFLKKTIFDQISYNPFHYWNLNASVCYGEYLLEYKIALPSDIHDLIKTTQDVHVTIGLSKISGLQKVSIEIERRIFYYTPEFQGWAIPILFEQATNKELSVLFRNSYDSQYYDLKNPLRTETLVDNWFQKLLSYSAMTIEKYI